VPSQLEWVKQHVLSAPGTGDTILLGTPVPGYIGFNTTGSGITENTPVRYTATDGEKIERGWAIYYFSTQSLTRVYVDAAFSNGVLAIGKNADNLDLTANAIITCEAVADNFQPQFEYVNPVFWTPRDNSTTADTFGISPTLVGTQTARTVDLTSPSIVYNRRLGLDTTASAGNVASWRTTNNPARINDIFDLKHGFKKTFIVGADIASYDAAIRGFVGLIASTAAPSNVNPSTLTNCIGFGLIDGSDNWHIVYGGSSAQTPINLGSTFNGKSESSGYLFTFESKQSVLRHTLMLTIEKLVSGRATLKESRVFSDIGGSGVELPTNLDLFDQVWRTNNTSAAVVPMDIGPYSSQYLL
jgi:hypothetical protein